MKNTLVFTDSRSVATDTGARHSHVVINIEKLIKRDRSFLACFIEGEFRDKRGILYKKYDITEQGNDILSGQMRGKIRPVDKVYLIQSGFSFKVGISGDVKKREQAINTACPLGAQVSRCYRFSAPSIARDTETRLHVIFAENQTNTEWFDSGGLAGSVVFVQQFNSVCLDYGGEDFTSIVTDHHPKEEDL